MALTPEEFLMYAGEEARELLARLRGRPRGDFFRAAEAALGPKFKSALRLAELVKSAAEASGSLQAFLEASSAAAPDALTALGIGHVYEASLGLGCPEPLAKAKALVGLLAKRLPDRSAELGKLESEIWGRMVEECPALAGAKRALEASVYEVEEI